eukprot:3229637-Ditylum_brightwellii.AAC.1
MPASDIINRNVQFLLGIEDAVRITDIKTHNACSILVVHDILLDNGLLTSHESGAPTLQGAMGGK